MRLRHIYLNAALCASLYPQGILAAKARPDFTKPQTFLHLADRFADEQDYYRAITEYKKVVFLFPDYEKLEWVHLQIGKMYYEGGRFAQAKNELIPLTESKEERLKFLSLNYIALSYYENQEFSNAKRVFDDLKAQGEGVPYTLDYTIYTGMASAGDRKFVDSLARMNEAKNIWNTQKATGAVLNPHYGEFFDKTIPLLEKASKLSPKSPFWATLFSALLPGGGHFFLGEWDTGIVSFSLVGAAAFLAYDGFKNDNTVQSVLFTTFATGAYIGQIYSSYRTARKYNVELGDTEWRELSRQFRSLNVALQFQSRF